MATLKSSPALHRKDKSMNPLPSFDTTLANNTHLPGSALTEDEQYKQWLNDHKQTQTFDALTFLQGYEFKAFYQAVLDVVTEELTEFNAIKDPALNGLSKFNHQLERDPFDKVDVIAMLSSLVQAGLVKEHQETHKRGEYVTGSTSYYKRLVKANYQI
jgi:hypothetical protein